MRLIQAMGSRGTGGAELFFVRLVAALAEHGVSQRLLIRRGAAFGESLRRQGHDFIELPFAGRWDFLTRRAFARAIESFRADIAVTWMTRATKACPANAPVHVGRIGGYYDLAAYRRCDHLIAISPPLLDYVRAGGWPKDRAHLIGNFVDVGAPAVGKQAAWPGKDKTLVVALARLHPVKGLDVLLKAVAVLPDVCLWLAGEGPQRSALEAMARALGIVERVRFLGWRDDRAALLAAADIVVVPSRREGLGNTMLEAWSMAKPVVVTATGGPASLARDGENALIVPVADASGLAAAIARLASDPALTGRIAERGNAIWRREYSREVIVRRYLDLFAHIRDSLPAGDRRRVGD